MPRTVVSLSFLLALSTSANGQPVAQTDTILIEAENPYKPPPPIEDIREVYSHRALDLLCGVETVKADMMGSTMAANYRRRGPVTFSRELCGYPVEMEGRYLTPAEIDTLTAMILAPDHYEDVKYLCLLSPEFAFTFTTWNDTASVFICTDCLYVYFCDGEEWLATGTLKEEERPNFRRFAEAVWSRKSEE